jgi:predicted transcriptional regulator
MAEAELDLKRPVALAEEEGDGTLAAIDRGVRDADAGRVTAIEEIEKMLPQWISKSPSPTKP